eukprot:Sdes_comp20526_c0_seq15m15152
MQIGVDAGDRWLSSRVGLPHGLQCTLYVPDQSLETCEARSLLTLKVSRKDAVFNLARVALLIQSFSSGSLQNLSIAMDDHLHQSARSAIMPYLFPMIQAALNAGAHGCFLSGAGSTVLAITSGKSGDIYTQTASERKETCVEKAFLEGKFLFCFVSNQTSPYNINPYPLLSSP